MTENEQMIREKVSKEERFEEKTKIAIAALKEGSEIDYIERKENFWRC